MIKPLGKQVFLLQSKFSVENFSSILQMERNQ
jgi:hypothetical protein